MTAVNLALTLESRLAEVLDLTEQMAAGFGLTRRERSMLTAPLFLLLCDLEEAGAATGDEQGDDPAPAPPGTITTPAWPYGPLIAVPPLDMRGATWTATAGDYSVQQQYQAGATPASPHGWAEQPEQPAPRVAVVPDPQRELTPVEAAALAQVLNEEAVVPRPRLVLLGQPSLEICQFPDGRWTLNDAARAEMLARGESPDDYLAGLNAGIGDVTP